MGKKALLIGGGPSANTKMDYDSYNFIVGVNDTCLKFDVTDSEVFHVVSEIKKENFLTKN